jgi:hypothetical protein
MRCGALSGGGEAGGWLDARGRGGSSAIVNTGYGPPNIARHVIDAHFEPSALELNDIL